jgi:hypothetical protein
VERLFGIDEECMENIILLNHARASSLQGLASVFCYLDISDGCDHSNGEQDLNTEDSDMGFGCPQVGDDVWVLLGRDVSLILRPDNNSPTPR